METTLEIRQKINVLKSIEKSLKILVVVLAQNRDLSNDIYKYIEEIEIELNNDDM